jgi:hypothetical protein
LANQQIFFDLECCRIDQSNLRTGKLRDDEWGRLSEAVEKLGKAAVFIDEGSALSPSELRARARRQARQCGQLGLIVVDYLQLMSGSGGGSEENRATVIGEISRGLKALAKELQCPVIALSQLNRSVESRTDKRPMMSDLRESGCLAGDTRVALAKPQTFMNLSGEAVGPIARFYKIPLEHIKWLLMMWICRRRHSACGLKAAPVGTKGCSVSSSILAARSFPGYGWALAAHLVKCRWRHMYCKSLSKTNGKRWSLFTSGVLRSSKLC